MRFLRSVSVAMSLLMGAAPIAYAGDKIRIVHGNPSFGILQLLVAESMDYFEAAGLEVELQRVSAGSKVIATLVSDSADIAVTGSSAALYAQQEGIDMVVFGATINAYHTPIVYSKQWAEKNGITNDSPLADREKALRGAKIATTGPGGGDELIRFFAARAGLVPDEDMSILHFGSDLGAYLVAMEQGRIDGFAIGAPLPQIAARDYGAIAAMTPAKGEPAELGNYLYIALMALRGWLEANPQEAAQVAKAFQLALDAIHDPSLTNEARDRVHADYFDSVDKELFDIAWEEAKLSSARTVTVEPQAMKAIAEFVSGVNPLRLSPEQIEASSVKITAAP